MVKTQIDIRRAIAESGVSIAEVAERSGIDRSNISKLWLKVGDREPNPTLSKLVAVANAIGKDITELFYPVEESDKTEEQTIAPEEKKPTRVGMIMCPHCHCGFEITGVVTPAQEADFV